MSNKNQILKLFPQPVFKYQVNNYEKSIEQVIDYYKKLKLLKVVNGERQITEINGEISGIIETFKG